MTTTVHKISQDEARQLGKLRAPKAAAAIEAARSVGFFVVGAASTDEEIADWEKKLWHAQDPVVEYRAREWGRHLYYVAGEQYVDWHRDLRRYIPRRVVPWRIRAVYNICQKAVNLRVARLCENKPSVSVQAATLSRDDLDKAEAKEHCWWYLWHRLGLFKKLILARRWATYAGSGFLKCGWDADEGEPIPATDMVPKYEEAPALDPVTGGPRIGPDGNPVLEQRYLGDEEVYVNDKLEPLGPVYLRGTDAEGNPITERQEPPEGTAFYRLGEAFCDVRTPYNLRWDAFTDDLAESWYIQDADIMPASRILALFPDAADKLAKATPATDTDKAISWATTTAPATGLDVEGYATTGHDRENTRSEPLDKEYVVRQTWIFPKTDYVRRLWGEQGALLVTVGGILITPPRPLPKWARRACPFIQLIDTPEPGNHYGKSIMRDLIPMQDGINRSLSQQAERGALEDRLLIGAPQGHQMAVKALGQMPGVLVTYRSPAHKPEPINLATSSNANQVFYQNAIAAAADVGMMNDASTGKLPSAGLAAKAIYALQFAEDRGIVETSIQQDEALKRLATALDAIVSAEYKEDRVQRIVGPDQSFLGERVVSPAELGVDVDYVFMPGSMLQRQKEAVKNELLTLREAGLVDDVTVRKALPTAVPDAFKTSYDLQYAAVRRQITRALKDGAPVQLNPWQDPAVVAGACEEYLLSARYEVEDETKSAAVLQLWQQAKLLLEQQAAAQAAAGAAGAEGEAGGEGAAMPDAGIGGMAAPPGMQGAQQLEQRATAAQEPPPGYGAA